MFVLYFLTIKDKSWDDDAIGTWIKIEYAYFFVASIYYQSYLCVFLFKCSFNYDLSVRYRIVNKVFGISRVIIFILKLVFSNLSLLENIIWFVVVLILITPTLLIVNSLERIIPINLKLKKLLTLSKTVKEKEKIK